MDNCMALNCGCLSDMQYGVFSAHSFIYMLMILCSTLFNRDADRLAPIVTVSTKLN